MTFETLHLKLIQEISGKSLFVLAEEITGVSVKTLRSGGPKRPNKIAEAKAQQKKWLYERHINEGGFSVSEAERLAQFQMERAKSNPRYLTWIVQSIQDNAKGYLLSEALAKTIDVCDAELELLKKNDDLKKYKETVLRFLKEVGTGKWMMQFSEIKGVRGKIRDAEDFSELDEAVKVLMVSSLFQFLACLDVEFQASYLTDPDSGQGLTPQPLFLLLMPALSSDAKLNSDGLYKVRGIFNLPLKRLLNISFCLAYAHRNKKWPLKRFNTKRNIAAWIGKDASLDTEQLLSKIYRGTKGLTTADFSEMWCSMCEVEGLQILPTPPWPLYFAAQMLTQLFVTHTQINGSRVASGIVVPTSDAYKYWWDVYYKKACVAGLKFGEFPWPRYLQVS
ncbi:hypothetical protein [Herbaspirillum lusitanum]|uniref:hypothetical protein n=1 Tax=Herbaspirillum lusitanum TaxID=213312 RepID=UPI00036DCB63|nr:hypothetical protein [Herbaspirillum lusitanum]